MSIKTKLKEWFSNHSSILFNEEVYLGIDKPNVATSYQSTYSSWMSGCNVYLFQLLPDGELLDITNRDFPSGMSRETVGNSQQSTTTYRGLSKVSNLIIVEHIYNDGESLSKENSISAKMWL